MRTILASSIFFATVAAALVACGGTDPIAPVDGGPTDGPVIPKDGGKSDGGGPGPEGGPVVCADITGTDSLAISAVSGPGGIPRNAVDKGKPVDGAGVRIETLDGSGCLDGTTDSAGKFTGKVSLAKGPFNVTIVKVGFGIASVMGVTSVADLAKLVWLPQPLVTKELNIQGAITGLKDPVANKVQIDSAWFATVFSGAGPKNYQVKHVYVAVDTVPVNLAGIEIDPANNAVQGEWMPDVARVNGPMTADMTFDVNAQLPKKSLITINLAGSGQLTGPMVKYVGDLTAAKIAWTNTTVAKSVGLSAAYVGIAILGKPTGSAAPLNVQWFDQKLQPDYASCFFTDQMGNGLSVNVKDFTDKGMVTVPAIAKLDVGANAATFGDVKITADGTGADFIVANITTQTDTVWRMYFPGVKVTGARLPNLPASVQFGDVSGGASFFVDVSAIKTPTKPTDWSEGVGGAVSDWAYSYSAQVTP